jgi:hypothetical protein
MLISDQANPENRFFQSGWKPSKTPQNTSKTCFLVVSDVFSYFSAFFSTFWALLKKSRFFRFFQLFFKLQPDFGQKKYGNRDYNRVKNLDMGVPQNKSYSYENNFPEVWTTDSGYSGRYSGLVAMTKILTGNPDRKSWPKILTENPHRNPHRKVPVAATAQVAPP